jgi:hypothetical protein
MRAQTSDVTAAILVRLPDGDQIRALHTIVIDVNGRSL